METASRLALLLTLPALPDIQTARRLFGELGFTVNSSTFFISFIIRMNTFPELSALEMFYQELSDFLEKRKINFIYTDKKHQNLLCFLFGQTEPSIRCFHEISDFICQRLSVLRKIFHCSRRNCIRNSKSLSVLCLRCDSFAEQFLFSGKYTADP